MTTNPTTTAPATITTIDQNTGREIVWTVEHVREHGQNVTAQYGWTHGLLVSRPKGRRFYCVDIKIVDGQTVKYSAARVAF